MNVPSFVRVRMGGLIVGICAVLAVNSLADGLVNAVLSDDVRPLPAMQVGPSEWRGGVGELRELDNLASRSLETVLEGGLLEPSSMGPRRPESKLPDQTVQNRRGVRRRL